MSKHSKSDAVSSRRWPFVLGALLLLAITVYVIERPAVRKVKVWQPNCQLSPGAPSGYKWISDDKIMADGRTPAGTYSNATRPGGGIVILDARKKSVSMISREASLLTYPDANGVFTVARMTDHAFERHRDPSKPVFEIDDAKDFRLTNAESPELVAIYEPGELPARAKRLSVPTEGIPLGSQVEGYIIQVPKDIDSTTLPPGCRPGPFARCTLWVRSGRPSLVVPIPFEEIADVEWSDYLKEFVLNAMDTSGATQTDIHLGRKGAGRYEYSPTWYLALDGTVREEPYPTALQRLGLKHFGMRLPTAVGELIVQQTNSSSNLYLFRDNRLVQLDVPISNSAHSYLPAQLSPVKYVAISYDGCKAAFSQANAVYGAESPAEEYSLVVIQLCDK